MALFSDESNDKPSFVVTSTDYVIPPPPPPLPTRAKARVSIPPAPPLPPNPTPAIKSSDLLRATTATNSHEPQPLANSGTPFQPCHMFFYSSLMDPEVLQTILKLPELPDIRRGSVTSFSIKM